MKAVLCGQSLLPARVLKGHSQVMASSEILNAEQPKLSWAGFFTCLSFCFVKIFLWSCCLEMYFIRHGCLLCLPPFVSRTHHWRGLCFSRDCSGHAFTVLNVWQVKKNKCPAGSSLAFGPALWLCPAKELHSPSPHSSLILATVKTPQEVTGGINLVFSMHVCHYCWLHLGIL